LSRNPTEEVILVSSTGAVLGTADRSDAHQSPGTLHLAFSVFVINSRGELLLQRRSDTKDLFASLWSNSCCSHPRPNESLELAARRRLGEELGMAVNLENLGTFEYRAVDRKSGLTEHELVHVFAGISDETPKPNPEEIRETKALPLSLVLADLSDNPVAYTPWLRSGLEMARDWWPSRHETSTRNEAAGADVNTPSLEG
jgi:isopentenyl-diphosphate delta-isomerase